MILIDSSRSWKCVTLITIAVIWIMHINNACWVSSHERRRERSNLRSDYCRPRLNVYKAELLVGISVRSSNKLDSDRFSLEGEVEVKTSPLKYCLIKHAETLLRTKDCYTHSLVSRSLKKTKLYGLSPRANYTDRATAACRRSVCQLLLIEGATWSEWRILTAVFSVF
jgi:hypothetical protein